MRYSFDRHTPGSYDVSFHLFPRKCPTVCWPDANGPLAEPCGVLITRSEYFAALRAVNETNGYPDTEPVEFRSRRTKAHMSGKYNDKGRLGLYYYKNYVISPRAYLHALVE